MNNWNARKVEELNKNELSECLQYFVVAVRKIDGSPYPPRTLKEIIACIQHHYKMEIGLNFSIFNDPEFKEVCLILETSKFAKFYFECLIWQSFVFKFLW